MTGGKSVRLHDRSKLRTENEVVRKKEMSIAEVGGNRFSLKPLKFNQQNLLSLDERF